MSNFIVFSQTIHEIEMIKKNKIKWQYRAFLAKCPCCTALYVNVLCASHKIALQYKALT